MQNMKKPKSRLFKRSNLVQGATSARQQKGSGNIREKLGKKDRLQKVLELPSITRFITEPSNLLRVAVVFLSIILLLTLILGSIRVLDNYKKLKNMEDKRAKIVLEIKYWQGIVQKYSDYRDGYFKLAVLEYQLGNKDLAKQYSQKSLELDTNYNPAIDFEKVLE